MDHFKIPGTSEYSFNSSIKSWKLTKPDGEDLGGDYQSGNDFDDSDDRLKSLNLLRVALSSAPFIRLHSQEKEWPDPPKTAVVIDSVSYCYQKDQPVLDKISMQVPQGRIYALIGPSGCGKTTLLKCILGRLEPSQGLITVFGTRVGEKHCPLPGPGVGYMPQKMSLIPEFTIQETLQYFGRLYNMPMALINERTNFLLSLLYLPDEVKFIEEINDGQKWRVSLAVSLIHSPPLLLLDEPTVGVDPLLRTSIWDHLNCLCREESITVIISSHYLDEASASYRTGLMRSGDLIAEDSPEELLQLFHTRSFEEVYLTLCQETDSAEDFEKSGELSFRKANAQLQDMANVNFGQWPCDYRLRANNWWLKLAKISSIVDRNLIKIRRKYLLLFFFFILPALQLALFCTAIGRVPKSLKVSVFNAEKPPILTRSFLRSLDSSVISQVPYHNLTSALNSLRRGAAFAMIHLAKNYTVALQRRLDRADITQDEFQDSTVKLHMDMTNPVISQQIFFSIITSFYHFFVTAINSKYLRNRTTSMIPVSIEETIYGEIKPDLSEYFTPGYILTTVFLTQMIVTAFLLITDKKDGLMERCLVTGTSTLQMLTAHFITQVLILSIQECVMLFLVFIIFRMPLRGDLVSVASLIFLQGLCGVSFGFFVSSLCPNPVTAMLLSSGFILPSLMISGLVWPTQSMPLTMQRVSYSLPLTLSIEALRYIVTRGSTIKYLVVAMAFGVLTFYTCTLLVLTVIIFRIKMMA